MLRFRLADIRRCAASRTALNAKAYSTAPAANATAADRAQHILGLKAPLGDKEASLMTQQQQFLRQLGANPKAEEIDLAFKVFDKVLDLSKGVDKFSCARLSLMCLNGGMPDRALEPWARLLETLNSRTSSPKALEKIIDLPGFEPAAMAALAAYFVIAGPAADPETARKLVPRRNIPSNLVVLRNLGGIQSEDAEQIVLRGLASLRKHVTHGFKDAKFIEEVNEAPFAQVDKLWRLVELSCKPNEIPEVCYAAFIRRFAATRQTRRSFDLWQKLVQSGVPVTILGWSSLLKAALLAPNDSTALFFNIWDKMLANGFTPDAACMTERLICLVRDRRLETALKEFRALQESKSKQLEIRGVGVILHALARQKRFDEVDEILKWAIDNGLEPNTQTYDGLISASSKPEISSKYLKEMIERGVKPSIATYTFAVQQMLKRGESIDAILDEMKEAKIEPNEQFNTMLVYYLGKTTKDISAAREAMQAILHRRVRLNIETVGAFVELELRYGDVERAAQHINLMHKYGMVPSLPLYNQLIAGAVRRGRLDVARETFDKMLHGDFIRLRPNNETYTAILKPWSQTDLQSNEPVRSLIRSVVPHLLDWRNEMKYSLAKRIEEISQVTGTDLIPARLAELASQQIVDQFDRRVAAKR